MADIKAIAEELVNLTVKEVNECMESSPPLQPLLLLLVPLQAVLLPRLKRRHLSMLFSLK